MELAHNLFVSCLVENQGDGARGLEFVVMLKTYVIELVHFVVVFLVLLKTKVMEQGGLEFVCSFGGRASPCVHF